ncbi:hypothetical protein [Leminorella grimontii]|uniref:hypothetical protein n=1 Tax=Leminorella grimontii TaxID=82981 RepID=UPI0032203DE0
MNHATPARTALSQLAHIIIVLVLLLPLCSQALAFLCSMLVDSSCWFSRDLTYDATLLLSRDTQVDLTKWFCLVIFCLGVLFMGSLYGKHAALPVRRWLCYGPFAAFIGYSAVIYGLSVGFFGSLKQEAIEAALLPFFWRHAFFYEPTLLALMAFLTYVLFTAGVLLARFRRPVL